MKIELKKGGADQSLESAKGQENIVLGFCLVLLLDLLNDNHFMNKTQTPPFSSLSLSLSKTQTLGFHYSGDLTKVRFLIFFSVGFTA